MFNICVFISGTGSNLQSIIDHQQQYNYCVKLVVSNNKKAKGLDIASQHDIPVHTFKWDKNDNELTNICQQVKQYDCKLIVLAGFMKILPKGFIHTFRNQIINIHPSLLPKYPGLHTHQRVLGNKDKIHGATVHYVNAELDTGKIISQTTINVKSNDTKESLAKRLLFREHSLLPHIIGLIGQNRVQYSDKQLVFDHKILTNPIEFYELQNINTDTKSKF